MATVSLYKRGLVVASALIDEGDVGLVEGYRWFLVPNGYALATALHPEGGKTPDGHRARRITYLMHRLILGVTGAYQADHINGDRLDNRRANLRRVTFLENQQNRASYRGSTSRYRGVSWNKGMERWVVYGCVNREKTHLGYFTDEHEAGAVAAAWRAAHMPFAVDR